MRRSWLAGMVVAVSGMAAFGQESGKGRISGRVVDALAEPVVAAEVAVAAWRQPDRVLARTRTDGDGFFVLGNVPFGDLHRVTASAPGRVARYGFVNLSAASPEGTVQLRLWDAGSVEVRVLDEDGQPLADSKVCAAFDDARVFGFEQVDGSTDADGKVTLTGVPIGRIHVRAWAPGFGVGEQTVALQDTAPAELRLQRGKGIRLEVRVQDLPASSRAEVWVIPYVAGGSQRLPSVLIGGDVDDSGGWQAAGLPADWEYLVGVRGDDLAFAPADVRIKARDGDQQLEFVAGRPRNTVLHGVLLGPEGEPLTGERLECRSPSGGARKQTLTAADGSFAIESPLAPGTRAVIYLQASRWVMAQPGENGDLRSLRWHEFTVDVQQKLELRAVLAATVRGVLVDDQDRPVALRRVTLQNRSPNRRPEWMPFQYATTARDGSFAFRGLRAPDCELRVGADDMGASVSAPFSLRDGQDVAGLRIVLAPSATIAGTVRDAQGAVVPGARVWLRDWNFDTNRQMSGNVVEVLTDRQGRYRFVDVVPGGHYLEIVEGPVGRRAQTEPFEVEPGKTLQFDLTAP